MNETSGAFQKPKALEGSDSLSDLSASASSAITEGSASQLSLSLSKSDSKSNNMASALIDPRQRIPARAPSLSSIVTRSSLSTEPLCPHPSPAFSPPIDDKASTKVSNDASILLSSADKLRRLEEFKRSPYYLAPFEDNLVSIPESQLHFMKNKLPEDFELFKQIAKEGTERRGKFGSGVCLVMKYGGKILANFIRNRQEEMNLPDSMKPKPEFFGYLGDLIQQGIDLSGKIKKDRPYTKSNIDPDAFYQRVDQLFTHFAQILSHSPFGLYLKWHELQLYKDDPTNLRYLINVIDEGADLFAQWRAMGYESSTFFGRRLVNMLRLFARSKMPTVDDI